MAEAFRDTLQGELNRLQLRVLALDPDDPRLAVYVRDLQRTINPPVLATPVKEDRHECG